MEHMMAIVMAAGHGKRMKSNRPKVLHTVCGKPMIDRVVAAAQDATGNKPVVVVGVGREAIMEHLGTGRILRFRQSRKERAMR